MKAPSDARRRSTGLTWIVGLLVVVCVVLIWQTSRGIRNEDFSSLPVAVSPMVERPPDPSPPGGRAFAVVDVRRILVALAKSRPPEKFDTAMAGEIRRVVAALAMERNLDLVFDRSGRSKHEIPVVHVSPAIADLTDAAIERLGP
jgi:hypothetical protein